MSDVFEEMREKQRELDNIRRRIRERDDVRFHSHAFEHEFSNDEADDGEHEQVADETEDLRERVADRFGVEPGAYAGVPADALRSILDQLDETDGDRSPPRAHMAGVQSGGSTAGADDADADDSADNAPPPLALRSPAERRAAWRKRNSMSSIRDRRGSPGYPTNGLAVGKKLHSESSDEDGTEREHTTDRDGYGDNGYPAKGLEAWRARNGDERDRPLNESLFG